MTHTGAGLGGAGVAEGPIATIFSIGIVFGPAAVSIVAWAGLKVGKPAHNDALGGRFRPPSPARRPGGSLSSSRMIGKAIILGGEGDSWFVSGMRE